MKSNQILTLLFVLSIFIVSSCIDVIVPESEECDPTLTENDSTDTADNGADTGDDEDDIVSNPSGMEMFLSPEFTVIRPGGKQSFEASITSPTGTVDQGVTWSLNPGMGSINDNGEYTGPGSPGSAQNVNITATSTVDASLSKVATVALAPNEESFSCQEWKRIRTTDFVLENNTWGKGSITNFEQCIFAVQTDHEYIGWEWSWPANSGHHVKGYPEVIFGQKPWFDFSTSSLLPARVSTIDEMVATYDITTSAQGIYNLAFEFWITSGAVPSGETITREVMFWVDHENLNMPENMNQGIVTIDGAEWKFLKNDTGSYIAFLIQGESRLKGQMNFHEFIAFLLEGGHIPADQYLASLEFGNEVIEGSGKTTIKDYQVTVTKK